MAGLEMESSICTLRSLQTAYIIKEQKETSLYQSGDSLIYYVPPFKGDKIYLWFSYTVIRCSFMLWHDTPELND